MSRDTLLTASDLFSELNTKMAEAGGNDAFAALHGIGKTHLSNMANCRRKINKKLLDALGLEMVVMFRRKQPAQNKRGKR